MTENNETMVNELIEAKVALAKAEMQLDKKTILNRSQRLVRCFKAWAKAQAEFSTVTATYREAVKNMALSSPLSRDSRGCNVQH